MTDPNGLRRLAEERLRDRQRRSGALDSEHRSDADVRRLQHELEVHQIELEMQNEALQQAQVATECALVKCSDLFDFAPTGYFNFARDGRILAVNLAGARLVGIERAQLINRHFTPLVSAPDRPTFNALLDESFGGTGHATCEIAITRNDAEAIYVLIEVVASADGQEVRATVIDVTERHHAEEERSRLIDELQQALEQVKLLSGMLPICASCKKIRDDQGYWNHVEAYIECHSDATFTHGLCPECIPKLYPGLGDVGAGTRKTDVHPT